MSAENATHTGACCLVLHTHLPYVHHPDYADFLEEDWLFEAAAETYLPILMMLESLRGDGIPTSLTMSLTPPLVTMLRTADLVRKLERWLSIRRDLTERELERLPSDSPFLPAAEHYHERFARLLTTWERVDRDIPGALAEFSRNGSIELMASAATHGMLPLFASKESTEAQIRLGVELHRELTGSQPRGFWLPECAWSPALEAPLRRNGIEWVVLEAHGVAGASPPPEAGVHLPLEMPEGLLAFGRDPESSREVWSSKGGYPGDPEYRELYRDLGYDADYRSIRPFLKPDGIRRNVGIKYHRVTGAVPLHEKEPWHPVRARDRAREHARDFLNKRSAQSRRHAERLHTAPVITAPYDTELFGHWWYEGPWFLEEVFRQKATGNAHDAFDFATPSGLIDQSTNRARGRAHPSTWGRGGYFEVWLNDRNHWFWPHLHEMEERMRSRVAFHVEPSDGERRILDQMARELLLAQSSDWPFIVTMETSVHYAERRFRDHVHRFFALEEVLDGKSFDEEDLQRVERHDAIFPDLDHRLWRGGD